MTITATRPPDAPAPDVAAPRLVPETWLTTSDHKRVGRMYIVAALVFLLAGLGVGVAMDVIRSTHGAMTADSRYLELFSLHSTVSALLFLAPLWVGLATYLVPLQIGARGLAFPRAQAFAFWAYAVGGALFLASFVFATPAGGGIALASPLSPTPSAANRGTDLWAASLIVVTLAAVLAAVNLFTTVFKLRADGMTLTRVPAFSWSVLATSAATVIAGPIFVAGMLLVYLDQHFSGHLFVVGQVNAGIVWQHLVWLYGRPDIYLLVLPALGAVSDIVATHARRPLFMDQVAKGAIFAFAVLSFAILTAGPSAAKAPLLPTPTVASALVVLPAGLCLLLWLATAATGRLHLHVSLLYVLGFVALVLLGAVNVLISAFKTVPGGSAWTTGQLHAVAVGAPTLAVFAAVYHWAPKIWGRHLRGTLGVLQWLALFGGFLLSALGSWLAGYDGAPWHLAHLTGAGAHRAWLALARLSVAGDVLVAVGILIFVVNLVVSVLGPGAAAQVEQAR